jgi:predicted Zn finger-like uncharacterized protein
MIVTCPECARRYQVDDRALASGSRTLRCGVCACTWVFHRAESRPQAAEKGRTPETALPPPLPSALYEGPAFGSDSSLEARKAPGRRLSAGWAFYAGVWIMLAGILVGARDRVVQRWPVLRGVYMAAGLSLRPVETLRVEHLHMWPVQGQNAVLLRGVVVNTGDQTCSVPLFRIRFEEEHPVRALTGRWIDVLFAPWLDTAEWTHQLSHRRVMPHESLEFEIVLPCRPGAVRPGMKGALFF